MALSQRITSLQKLHDEADKKIHELLSHPSAEDEDIRALKRERLGYKDSIVRLMAQSEQQRQAA